MDTTSISDLFNQISEIVTSIGDILPTEVKVALGIVAAIVIAVVIYKLIPLIG